jgi:hypothetical protein
MVHAAEGHLLQVILALDPPRRLARRLHGRQQQRDQDADDGDYDQKFDKGEAVALHKRTLVT